MVRYNSSNELLSTVQKHKVEFDERERECVSCIIYIKSANVDF